MRYVMFYLTYYAVLLCVFTILYFEGLEASFNTIVFFLLLPIICTVAAAVIAMAYILSKDESDH
jgi:hypothetical protein